MVANKTKCSEPTICLRNICKDVTLIPLYLINYSISANISILTWMQLISIIDCIGIWKTRFHSSNNTKELVLKVRCAVKVHRAGTCFHYMVQPFPSFNVSTWKRQKTLERVLRFRHSIGLCQRDNFCAHSRLSASVKSINKHKNLLGGNKAIVDAHVTKMVSIFN